MPSNRKRKERQQKFSPGSQRPGMYDGSCPRHNTTLAQPHMYISQAPAMQRSYFKQGLQIDSFRQKLDQAEQPQNQQPFSSWF